MEVWVFVAPLQINESDRGRRKRRRTRMKTICMKSNRMVECSIEGEEEEEEDRYA